MARNQAFLTPRLPLRYVFAVQPETPDESLSEREQVLLKVLVGSYIRDGQPVGSRALSREQNRKFRSP